MNASGYGRDVMNANKQWPEQIVTDGSGAIAVGSTNVSIWVRVSAATSRYAASRRWESETVFRRE